MIKVAFVFNMYSPYWNDLFSLLSGEYDIKILVSEYQEKNRKYLNVFPQNNNMDIVKVKSVNFDLSFLKIKTKYLHIEYGLWKELKKYNPDFIISNELGFRTLISYFYGKLKHIPVVPWIFATKHTEKYNSVVREFYRRKLLQNFNFILTNKTEAKKYLSEVLKVQSKKVIEAPYSIDSKKYQTLIQNYTEKREQFRNKMKFNDLVFLYVGQFEKRKGIDILTKSLAEIKPYLKEKFSILLIGGCLNNEQKAALETKAVSFYNPGFVQPEELPKYYAIADIFLFPSLEDEWGVVLNEAAAAGLPIITSKYAGAAEDIVKDGFNGRIIDPLTNNQLKITLEDFIKLTKRDLISMGENSFKMSLENDVTKTFENLKKLIEPTPR